MSFTGRIEILRPVTANPFTLLSLAAMFDPDLAAMFDPDKEFPGPRNNALLSIDDTVD
jgi:hypothetical protein